MFFYFKYQLIIGHAFLNTYIYKIHITMGKSLITNYGNNTV